jgi:deferrochelatase/peroxidase EfeB
MSPKGHHIGRMVEGLTRREALLSAGAVGAAAGIAGGGYALGRAESDNEPAALPFYGRHQAGVATPPQDYLQLAAFDFTGTTADDLAGLLRSWSDAAAALARGETPGGGEPSRELPPVDTGEAVGLSPSRLTLTFGVGRSLFLRGGPLGVRAPAALAPLPTFPQDALEPRWSDGDICVQACADDLQVAFHAVHVLTRLAGGKAIPRWSQAGFRGQGGDGAHRNLLGFKDGTRNLTTDADADQLWVGAGDEPRWMVGGTYMVVRRIRLLLDVWDLTSLEGQERAVGRTKVRGTPLGGKDESEKPDLAATGSRGPVIPSDAHIRLAAPETNGGAKLLRRGYSYSAGVDGAGQLDAGLIFICFQRDPHAQFVPVQRRLSRGDALGKHVLHVGSAAFACLPGAHEGGFVGETLFA